MKKLLHYFPLVAFVFLATPGFSQYCTTGLYTTGCTWGDDLDDVTLANVVQTATGCSTNGFEDYTGTDTIQVQQSLNYPISITSNFSNQYYGLWVDFNNDGDWDDAGEYIWYTTVSGQSANATFTIPLATATGTYRARLRGIYNVSTSATGSCSSQSYGETHDYMMVVSAAPACPPPTGAMVLGIGSTDASVIWTGAASSYNIEYDTTGFVLGAGTTTTASTDSVYLSGLMPNTEYTVYVQGDCTGAGNGLSPWGIPVTFRTACSPYSTFPLTENFDGSSWVSGPNSWNNTGTLIDPCWMATPTAGNFFGARTGDAPAFASGPSSGYGGTGGYLLAYQDWGYTNDTAVMVSPIYDFSSLTTPYVTFKYHMFGGDIGSMVLQATSNSGASWTTVSTISGEKHDSTTAAWSENTALLTGFNQTAVQLRFLAITTAPGVTDANMAVDNFVLSEAPACPPPSNIAATASTDSSITFSWTATSTAFSVEYGLCGSSQGTGTVISGTGTSVTITGLTSNESYNFWFQADCSGSANGFSTWADYGCEKTLCGSYDQVMTYTDNFDGGVSGEDIDCWFGYGSSATATVQYQEIFSWNTPNPSGPNVGEMYWNNDSMALMISPVFSDLDNNAGQIQVSLNHNLWSQDTLEVYVVTLSDIAIPSVYSIQDTLEVPKASYGNFTVFLDNVSAGEQHVAFMVKPTTTFAALYMDDYTYEAKPNCLPTTTHTVVATSIDSIALSWSGGSGTTYNIEYNQCGSAQGTGVSLTGLTSSSTTISGLSTGTNYSFWIQDDCGAGSTSPWYGPFCVSTDVCLPTDQCTYTIIMEDSFGDGWNNGLVSLVQGGVEVAEVGSTFLTGNWDTAYVNLCTGVSTDVVLKDQGFYSSEMGLTIIDPFGNTSVTVAPSGFPGPVTGDVLGNFLSNCTPPSCPDPSNISFSAVDGYGATSSWSVFGTSYGFFNVEWGPTGFFPGQGTGLGSDTSHTTSYTISGLIPVTCYDFYVQADCSPNGTSAWIGPFNFCTTVSCPAPTALTLSAVTQNTADFSWTSTASDWNIVVGPQGVTPTTGTVQFGITSNMHTLTSLSAGTLYDFWVRDSCGVGDVSTWSGPFTFATLCNAFPLNYSENFNAWTGGPLPCWDNNGTASWQSESGYAKADFWFNSSGVYDFTSPAVTISGQSRLRFKWSSNTSAFYTDEFIVMSRITGAATWDTLMHLSGSTLSSNDGATNTSPGTFVEDTFNLSPSYIGNDIQIMFRGISDWGPNLYLDDVVVELDPAFVTCPAPTGLTASNTTTTSADLAWTGGSGTFVIEYGAPGFPVGSGMVVTSTTPSVTLTGLTVATNYCAYVREVCAPGDTSVYSSVECFNTELCDPVNQCEYTFILEDTFGDGWNGGLISVRQNGVLVGDLGATFTTGLLDTATLDLCDGLLTEISLGNPGSYFTEMFFSIVDPSGVVVYSYAAGTGAGTPGYVFTTFNSSCSGCGTADTTWESSLSCAAMDIDWNPSASAVMHYVEYGTAGFTPGSGTMMSGTTLPISVTGLTPGTAYEYHVMDSCSAGTSGWSNMASVMTPTGPMPTVTYTATNSNITLTASTFDFDASASMVSTYHWDFGGGDTSNLANPSYDFTANGSYPVTLTVYNGCGMSDSTFTVVVTGIGLAEPSFAQNMNIYPNPTHGNVEVEFSVQGQDDVTIRFVNALGQIISEHDLGRVTGDVTERFDLTSQPKGVYLLQIDSNEGRVIRRITLQ